MNPECTSVTGVMVTGKSVERYPMARRAVNAWIDQDYPGPRQFLIINDHPDTPLFTYDELQGHPEIFEMQIANRRSLGALRNLAIMMAHTEYLVQWDDDDYSRNDRLRYQVQHTESGKSSIFRWEIHCNIKQKQAFANCGDEVRCKGFPGTMLWPRNASARFPDKGKAEDTEFVLDLLKETGVAVLDNDPRLYTRFYHGNNTWSEKHVMKRKRNSRDLTPEEQRYVDGVLDGPYSALCG